MRHKIGVIRVKDKPANRGGKVLGRLIVDHPEWYVEVLISEQEITELIAALQTLRSTVCAARKELQN